MHVKKGPKNFRSINGAGFVEHTVSHAAPAHFDD